MAKDFPAIAEQYARDVVAGKIVAGKFIRLACQQHLDDLEWQADDNFKYRFDHAAATRACKFVELMPHTKGKWAAEKKTLILEPWQVFAVCCIFGWLKRKDNLRRYRRAFILIPRKNGKSALAAAIGLYMLVADGEHGAEVYSGAKTEIQAKHVFTPARMMALKRPDLCARFGLVVNASNLHVVANGSKFEPLIGNPGDGGSPSCALIDEYHEHPTDALYNTMETGMGAREQPLIFVITTAGDNIAGPCYEMQKEVEATLIGARDDAETFGLLYTIDDTDDWEDFDVWIKANPNYGVSVQDGYLRSAHKDALINARTRGAKLTKHLNMWVQAKDAYFDTAKYIKNADPSLSIDDFAGQEAIIGVDLAEKLDLTAVEIVFQHKGGFARFGRYYAPEETIAKPENEHFQQWRDEGFLIETEGAVTDDRVIEQDILDLCERFDVREVAFDPHHARQITIQLMEQGVPCIEFGNRPLNMNEPMRKMDALIAENKLYHNGDRAFSWMLSNVVPRSKTHDLHSPGKTKPANKIDGPVACMMALGRWMVDDKSNAAMHGYFEDLARVE